MRLGVGLGWDRPRHHGRCGRRGRSHPPALKRESLAAPLFVSPLWLRFRPVTMRVRPPEWCVLPHRLLVEEIPRRASQQVHELMARRRPVGDGLRHRIWLRPDDLGAQIPAVRLQGEREAGGDHAEVFGLEAVGRFAANRGPCAPSIRFWPVVLSARFVASVRALPPRALVRRCTNPPCSASTSRPSAAPGAPPGTPRPCSRRIRSGVAPRPISPSRRVVTQAPVGRRGDDAMHGLVRQ